MSTNITSKLPILNTIAIWVLAITIIAWLCFKDDNKLNKETITNLTVAVEKFSVASENMSNAAKAQRDWAIALQESVDTRSKQRNHEYENLYGKYGYDGQSSGTSLADLYNVRVHESTEGNDGRDVRRDENGASKTPIVSGSTSKP